MIDFTKMSDAQYKRYCKKQVKYYQKQLDELFDKEFFIRLCLTEKLLLWKAELENPRSTSLWRIMTMEFN